MRGYRRSWAVADLGAAAALLVIAVPEQLATARLAGMPPVTGLYAFIAATVVFAMLGSSPQLSVGADSTIAPLFAVGIGSLAVAGSSSYIALVGILAVAVGVIVALVGLMRLGWIAEFLSAPIISGFLAGVAVIIVVRQLPDLLGLPGVNGSTLHRLRFVAGHIDEVSGAAVGIGVGMLAIVFVAERLDRRIPGALIGLVVTTVGVGILGLERHGVTVLGPLAHGAPDIGVTGVSWSTLRSVIPVAVVVALVVVSQTAATTRAFAGGGGHEADVNRDFVGVGFGNVLAGLLGAFPVNASPPRTAAVALASGRSQVAGLAAAAAVVLLIPAAGLLQNLPLATLAAVLIIVAFRMFRVGDIIDIARFDRIELALALVTLLTVALVGVEQGIGVAVALAILDRTRLSARPQLHVLGRIPATTSWAPVNDADRAAPTPGVLVVLFATPLWYANAIRFRTEMIAGIDRADAPLDLVVLDVIGMSDLDYTGSRALRQVLDHLEHRGITFAMARTGDHVRGSLERSGLLQRIGEDHLFASVDEAIVGLHTPKPPPHA